MVISLLVSPAAKLSAPDSGPVKSAPLAAGALLRLITQLTDEAAAVLPLRSTSKVKGVEPPELPSALLAETGTIDSTGGATSSFWMMPCALAFDALMVAP